jgi:hypothetical protein
MTGARRATWSLELLWSLGLGIWCFRSQKLWFDTVDPFWLHRGREMAPLIGGRSVANFLHHLG